MASPGREAIADTDQIASSAVKRDRTFSCFDFSLPGSLPPDTATVIPNNNRPACCRPVVLSCISVVYRFFTFTQRTCMPLARAYASAGAMPPVPVSFSYQTKRVRLRAVHGGSPVKSLPRLRDIRTGIQLHLRFILRNINILNLAVVVAAASAAHEERFGFSVGQRSSRISPRRPRAGGSRLISSPAKAAEGATRQP